MLRISQEALTFDDVLLIPGYSEVLPKDVSLKTRLGARASSSGKFCGSSTRSRMPKITFCWRLARPMSPSLQPCSMCRQRA